MKKLRLYAFGSGISVLLGTALLGACGDDTVVNINDGGTDGSADATADVDVGDAAVDATIDQTSPTPRTPVSFAAEVESRLCGSLTRCCFANGNLADGGAVDGGTYSGAACHDLFRGLGFELSSIGISSTDAGAGLTVDNAKAEQCLTAIGALQCSLTSPDLVAARTLCFEALIGSKTAGQACSASIECAKGHFCDPSNGQCAALRTQGENCSIVDTGNPEVDSYASEDACSWRSSGDTKLHCNSYDGNTGDYRPRDEWTCEPEVDVGTGCNSTVWCKDSICEIPTFVCTTPVEYFSALCERVINP